MTAQGRKAVEIFGGGAGSLAEASSAPMYDMIELMFFAYREFAGDADQRLEALGLGRAHHRVLHFVARQPGLTVTELLEILRVTKQSLNRVLKALLDKKYVDIRAGIDDRRQRRLYATACGHALALDIARLQSERLSRVFDRLPEGARSQAAAFLLAMIDTPLRDKVAAMTGARQDRGWNGER